jgi:hypothetical protein
LTVERLEWGHPPVPFLARGLAAALEAATLPFGVGAHFGSTTATAVDLSRSGLDRLPRETAALNLMGEEIVDWVSGRATELLTVAIGADLPRDISEALRTWPVTPRNALLRGGLGADLTRLRELTFGGLLQERMVGVRTALEIAALLETSAAMEPPAGLAEDPEYASRKFRPFGLHSQLQDLRWGEPQAPLLPATLRRAFADDLPPAWLARDLLLPPDATLLALDASIWRHFDELPSRVEQYLVSLISYRLGDIRNARVLEGGWRSDVDPAGVAWPTRIGNCLAKSSLLDRVRLSKLTYGELLGVPSLGPKSALEFAVIAEALGAPAEQVIDGAARESLAEAANEGWAERIRADDGRLRDVAPPYPGSLSELFDEAIDNPQGARAAAIAESLPAIWARVEAIDSQPLDVALRELLLATGTAERNAMVVMTRLGWNGAPPQSLQEVGDEFGITRERVRQIATKALDRLASHHLPQLDASVQLLIDEAPITVDAASDLLQQMGYATGRFHPAGVLSAAAALRGEVDAHIGSQDGVEYVLARGSAEAGKVITAARREACKVGLSNVDEVQARVEAEGDAVSQTVVRRLLKSSPRITFLVGDWFWMPGLSQGRNRLRNVSRRMLSVSQSLDLNVVRQGIRRAYSFRHIDLVPPLEVLREFYLAHPEFALVKGDHLESAVPLDYRQILGDVERVFVEVLRESPTGLMDRDELEGASIGRGVNTNTFAVFTTYSPILAHPALNVWSLCGQSVDPTHLTALQLTLATKTRVRRTVAYGWQGDGTLALTTIISSTGSPVIGVPHDIAHYVAGRRFEAVTREGGAVGFVVVDETGVSWGYGPFLRRRGAEPGDVLSIAFDISESRATLSLSPETELEETV